MKNNSCLAGLNTLALTCQACIVSPIYSSIFSYIVGNQVLTTDMDFFENHTIPIIFSIQLTTSLHQFFELVAPASSQFVYSVFEARQYVLNSFRRKSAEIPEVKRMLLEALDHLTTPIIESCSSSLPATSAVFSSHMPNRTATRFSLASFTDSFLLCHITFALFDRPWRCLFLN